MTRTICVFFGGLSLLLIGVSAIHSQDTLTKWENRSGVDFPASSLSLSSSFLPQGAPKLID